MIYVIRSLLNFTLLSLALLGSFSGCTTAQLVESTPEDSKELPHTAMIVEFEFRTEDPVLKGESCELNMRNTDHNAEYRVPAPVGGGRTIISVLPGRYQIDSIYCYASRQWTIKSESEPALLPVRTGKLNYAGLLVLEENSENQDTFLRWYRHAEIKTFKKFYDSLSPSDRNRLVQGVDGHPIRM